jgi:hypothetical protein
VEEATTVHCISLKNGQQTHQHCDLTALTLMIDNDESAIAAILKASIQYVNATAVSFTNAEEALCYFESESVPLTTLH